jgi:hypothetical protein
LTRFYSLSGRDSGDADTTALREPGFNRGDALKCCRCGEAVSLMSWLPPFRVLLQRYGKDFGDIVFLPGSDFLVSERFRGLYGQSGLTGLLDFEAVTVVKVQTPQRNRPETPQYYKVGVHYGRAALDLTASDFEWEHSPTCDECRTDHIKRWKRLVVEEATWTGEDAFRPRGMFSAILVTERFKTFCEEHQITNAEFTPAEQAGHDFYPGEKNPAQTPRESE